MTAASAIATRSAARFRLPLAWSIALRELRSGAGGLTVFVLCIALGVAAVAAIGSLAASFNQALARQGRLLIGGDLSFELIHRQANPEERAALLSLGQVSESASFRAMARADGGKTVLIEVKAVDDAYPLYGEVAITRPEHAGPVWRSPGVVLAERALLDRLGLEVGSTLSIGEAKVTIGGRARPAARPACRPPGVWAEAVDVAGDAGQNRPGAARQPDPLDLSREAAEGRRHRQGRARHRAHRNREQVSASRLRHQ